jgi:hypothetical protein
VSSGQPLALRHEGGRAAVTVPLWGTYDVILFERQEG